MTDLEKLAVEAMTELVDSKCVNCEDGEAGLLGTSIPVLAKFLERAHAAGRIEGLEVAAAKLRLDDRWKYYMRELGKVVA